MPGSEGAEYRTAFANPYSVLYKFDDERVIIYRVLHQRQSIGDYTLVDLK